MHKQLELLAPGGDPDAIKAAIFAGANAVYCGINKFNARNRAANTRLEDLPGIIKLAHQHNCEVFLTLNILILDSEIPDLIRMLNKLMNTSIDGVIIQDLGLFHILKTHFPSLRIHASTQCTTHNSGQISFLKKLGAERVNLSRELSLVEIKQLSEHASKENILTEVFVHGSNCISFSGICYMSSVQSANSGNRGRCSQPCRDAYETTKAGKNYPLNLKDNSAFDNLKEIQETGAYSLKIEGRIKEFEYVYTTVNTWRKHLDNLYANQLHKSNNADLYKVFNRDFSNTFLSGEIHKDMFIDNPMSHSIAHIKQDVISLDAEALEKQIEDLSKDKEKTRLRVKQEIDRLNLQKLPLKLKLRGKINENLQIVISAEDIQFTIQSKTKLSNKGNQSLSESLLRKRFKTINDTAYILDEIDVSELENNVFLPFSELTSLRNKIWKELTGKDYIAPITLDKLKRKQLDKNTPKLSVLISDLKDLDIQKLKNAEIYYELPSVFSKRYKDIKGVFETNSQVTPYFPSVLIGKEFDAAVQLLKEVKFHRIITNNSGIAMKASELGTDWIAGPEMNIANSYSLISLQENFNCKGAFVSNELSKGQINYLKKPENFELHYQMYHPVLLMSSRQCLLHQVSGCAKSQMDEDCLYTCNKSARIKNKNGKESIISKQNGKYHHVYHNEMKLNTSIVKDFSILFDAYLIDLRNIETDTQVSVNKEDLVLLFQEFITGKEGSEENIKEVIQGSFNALYRKGI